MRLLLEFRTATFLMNACIKTCKSCLSILLIGVIGAVACLTPFGINLEEEFGLSWLFKLRGPIPPPDNVVIVSIDRSSAEILNLPENPEKWPRSYYTQLIEKLNQQKPALIAINIVFGENRDSENDQLLARTIAKDKNIILSNYLKRNIIPSSNPLKTFSYERIIDSIPIIKQAALGTAPFLLPKTASTVKQFWTYKNNTGSIATFPGAVFHCFVFKQAYPEILQLLGQINPPLSLFFPTSFEQLADEFKVIDAVQAIQTEITKNTDALTQLNQLVKTSGYTPEKKELLTGWLALLDGSNSLYFNHYGSAGTITTIPFYQALASDIINPSLFYNKIILIGYSEDIEPEKNQGIYTVFSSESGEITSPIEIAATAVSNLVHHNWIEPIQFQDQFLLILSWGILLSIVCRFFPYKLAISLIILLSLGFVTLAYIRFTNTYTWIPVFIPIIVQTPLVLIIASVSRYRKRKQDHQNMHKAFSRYVPDDVVKNVAYQPDISAMSRYGEIMQGICMATDADQYTTLSETMNPQQLNDLMNNYYGVMFPQVTEQQGFISDVIGDAMLAIWAKPEITTQIRENACHAALKIKQAVIDFNGSQTIDLPTRLGLHLGEIRLGNVGAADHYEYRAIGDTVNTATRIEGLNKILGTNILVSAEVINGLSGFLTREMGLFILKGKTQPVHIYELICETTNQLNPHFSSAIFDFSIALKLYQQQLWNEALEAWLNIERKYPGDKPTQFYIHYLKQNLNILTEQDYDDQPVVVNIGNNTTHLHFQG